MHSFSAAENFDEDLKMLRPLDCLHHYP